MRAVGGQTTFLTVRFAFVMCRSLNSIRSFGAPYYRA